MERANFTMELSPELKKERRELFEILRKNTIIQDFLSQYHLDESFIEENAYQLKDYLLRLKKCEHCSGLDYCTQEQTGYILSIDYDGEFVKVLKKCSYLEDADSSTSHASQMLINDMSDEQLRYTFMDTDINNDSPKYMLLFNDLLNAVDSKSHQGFFLYGEPGVGKTYLACCFINAIAKKQKKVAFVHVPTIIANLKTMMYDNVAFRRTIGMMKRAEVLILDDIGGESASTWSRDDILLPLLNERMEKGMQTIFTSNYSYANLELFYTLKSKAVNDQVGAKRLVERMKSLASEKVVSGSNRRVKNSRN